MEVAHAACGILFTFNEEQIIRDTLRFYLSQGIDLAVFDNNSTDSTLALINSFRGQDNRYRGKMREVITLSTEGYEWSKMLRTANDYMHKHLNHYDWISLIDADAFYSSPVEGVALTEFMHLAAGAGYNILNGKLYEFYPTEKDDCAVASPLERMRYYQPKEDGMYRGLQHQKIFRYHPSVDFYTFSGHICRRDNPRVCKSIRFIYRHYPWVSYEHGLKKIFQDRKPRYVERREDPFRHWHWLGILPIKKDLVKDWRQLHYYDEDKALASKGLFLCIMNFPVLSYLRDAFFSSLQSLRRLTGLFRDGLGTLYFLKSRYTLRSLVRHRPSNIGADLQRFKLISSSYKSFIGQDGVALSFPATYHFLMTDFCDRRCAFCNQPADSGNQEQMTLEKFKAIAANIPAQGNVSNFVFSGGGEPFLCRELFPIIKFCRQAFPQVNISVRTNGFLLLARLEELAQSGISRLEVSVHGRPQTNDALTRSGGSEDIFQGLALLNERLGAQAKKMHKAFYPCVSRANIEDLPWMVNQAAQLRVDAVSVSFRRYFYSGSARPEAQDSLFFHQRVYNDIIAVSQKLARRSGVKFEYEPLFGRQARRIPCLLPWTTAVVGWDGTLYPCNGGEAWFQAKVKTGRYHFGNLLKEHLYQCWNNQAYIMLRRTCGSRGREEFIPECRACHNVICLQGPDSAERHILQIPS